METRKRKQTPRETKEALLPTPRKQPHKSNNAPVKCEGETKENQSPITIKCESETEEDAKRESETKDNLFNASQETVQYEYDTKSDPDDDEKEGVLAQLLDDRDSEDDTLSWLINADEKNQTDSSTTKLTVQSDDSSRDSNDILLSFI